jgi:hypothetical protein
MLTMAQASSMMPIGQRAAAVLRVLRGEDAAAVAKRVGVSPDLLAGWLDLFLQGGRRALCAEPVAGGDGEGVETETALTVDDDPLLDWAVEQERLGAMVLRAGELLLQQRARTR